MITPRVASLLALCLFAAILFTHLVLTLLMFFPHYGENTPFCTHVQPAFVPKPQLANPPSTDNPSDDQVMSYFGKKSFLPSWVAIFIGMHFLMKGLNFCFSSKYSLIFEGYFSTRRHRTRALAVVILMFGFGFSFIAIFCGIGISKVKNSNCAKSLLKMFITLLTFSSALFLLTGIAMFRIIGLYGPSPLDIYEANPYNEDDLEHGQGLKVANLKDGLEHGQDLELANQENPKDVKGKNVLNPVDLKMVPKKEAKDMELANTKLKWKKAFCLTGETSSSE